MAKPYHQKTLRLLPAENVTLDRVAQALELDASNAIIFLVYEKARELGLLPLAAPIATDALSSATPPAVAVETPRPPAAELVTESSRPRRRKRGHKP